MIILISLASLHILIFPFSNCQRYGVSLENCPDGSEAERDRAGNVKWCMRDGQCSDFRKCIPSGTHHFGNPINYCCPTKASSCTLPLSPGFGECNRPSSIKYYFDTVELRCKPFQFIECKGGNLNRFNTIDECERFCQSTACNAGESLYVSSLTGYAFSCAASKCPANHRCVYDSLFRRHVCCGHVKQDYCPSGHVSYSDPTSLTAKRCRPSLYADQCPPDFFCVGGSNYGYCCSPEKELCPVGQKPYEHPVNGKSIKCDPMRQNQCSPGYSCVVSVPGANWGVCCSDAIQADCPLETTAYLDQMTRQPFKCTVGVTVCRSGFICQSTNSNDIIGFCCSEPKHQSIDHILEEINMAGVNKNPYQLESVENGIWENENSIRIENENEDTPERRIIDIQKEVDAILGTPRPKTRKRKEETTKSRTTIMYLQCPKNGHPVFYPGTQLIYECSATSLGELACPEEAECVPAVFDLFGRSVCCHMEPPLVTLPSSTTTTTLPRSPRTHRYTVPNEELVDLSYNSVIEPPKYVYTVTLRPPTVSTESTSDPFCPSVIRGRACTPGVAEHCPEYGFFCQYNIELRKFKCCSMDH